MSKVLNAAVLTVSLAALASNYRLLQSKLAPGCRAAGIVKADAYGIGMAQVVPVLAAAGCPFYFVATLAEAIACRAFTAKPIAILNGVLPGDEAELLAHDLTPVLNSLAMLDQWRGEAERQDRRLSAILHIDTGMNRLGLGVDELEALLNDRGRLDGIDLKLIMSHFACADEQHPLNAKQIERFAAVRKHFADVPASLANSAAIFLGPQTHFEIARPGMALYGLNPTPETKNPMQAVARLDVPVLQVRAARKGESVGYGASHTLAHDTTLATVVLGYADGFLRSLSNRGTLYYEGQACPILGRVSMDLTIVDCGNLAVRPGETMEVLGPHQDADTLATAAGTIGYEILTGLGPRYRRVYQ